MLKLKLQYFSHLMRRADSFEKTLMLGKIVGRRRRGQQRMRWLNGITDSWRWAWVDSGSWWWTGRPGVLWSMGSLRVGHDWETELNWTEDDLLIETHSWFPHFSKRISNLPFCKNFSGNLKGNFKLLLEHFIFSFLALLFSPQHISFSNITCILLIYLIYQIFCLIECKLHGARIYVCFFHW